jgi:uncharacterized protein YpmB
MKKVTVISLVVLTIVLVAAYLVMSNNKPVENPKDKASTECQSKCAKECAEAADETDCKATCAKKCVTDTTEAVVPGADDCQKKHANGECDHSK